MAATSTLFSSLPEGTGPHVGPVAVASGRKPGRGWAALGWRVMAGAAVVVAMAVVTTGHRADAAGVAVSWTGLAGTQPPALRGAAAAYDTDNRTVVLFGGTKSDGTPSDQTWVFDGAHWALSSGSAPAARTGASMAFDAAAHELILFGGQDAGGAYLGDTWAWNGAQWFPASPTTAPPPARTGASLAVDPSGNLVLFGGTGAGTAPAGATPAGGAPSPAATPAAAATSSQAVHSQATAPVTLGDTWTWNGTTWTPAAAPVAPPARVGAAMAYDAIRHRTVLFGGASQPGGSAGATATVGDTWLWDGTAWTQAAPASSPPARTAAALVGDTVVSGAVLVGGSVNGAAVNDSWVWDGSTWTPINPGNPPPATAAAASAFDAATGQMLLVGGIGATGTLNAGSYLLGVPPPASPPPVASPSSPTTIPTPQPTVPTAIGRPVPSVPPFTSPTTRTATAPSTTVNPPVGGRPSPPGVAADPSTPPVRALRPGAAIVLLGAGFMPGATIDISFHSVPEQVATVTASSTGTFSVKVLVPKGADPGDHHFVMTGPSPSGAQTSISTPVLVMAVIPVPGPSLQTPIMVGIAILLPVGTWVTMVVLARRRQRAPGPA